MSDRLQHWGHRFAGQAVACFGSEQRALAQLRYQLDSMPSVQRWRGRQSRRVHEIAIECLERSIRARAMYETHRRSGYGAQEALRLTKASLLHPRAIYVADDQMSEAEWRALGQTPMLATRNFRED